MNNDQLRKIKKILVIPVKTGILVVRKMIVMVKIFDRSRGL